jgi:hypothetical protein
VREHLGEVFVAPSGEADEDELGVEVERTGKGVCRLERRQDPLRLRETVERGERSSSVAVTYSARPESRRAACSGPTPG